MKDNKEILIVGAGISGITLGEKLAKKGYKIIIIDRRSHIGGNCYDFINEDGILAHEYGPHIFHTGDKGVWDYLSRFTQWRKYEHKVLGYIDGKYVPIPFNLNSLGALFPLEKARRLEKKLIDVFGLGGKVPILELKKSDDNDLKELADYIYEKVFLHYNEKQWGLRPEEIDPAVSGRVPVFVSCDDQYFQDKYQGIPIQGYTEMFAKMIANDNMQVLLNTDLNDFGDIGGFDAVFYTGPIDEFFNYKHGKLDYRSIKMEFKTCDWESYQPAAVVNYPNDNNYTRITEFKKLTGQKNEKTAIGFEYPGTAGFLAYPVLNERNKEIYLEYKREADNLADKGIYFVGRLAEYKYYDMDDAISNVLNFFDIIVQSNGRI